MDFNSRIKIKIADNKCTIQTEKNNPDTLSNSVSLNVSKSDEGELLNENIEISMQSIFISEKKKQSDANTISIAPSKLLSETPTFTVGEHNKLLLNQLSICPNSFHSTLNSTKNSAGNSVKNTTSTKQDSNVVSLKNVSPTTSPFNSIGNTHSNSHSISSSFVEKKGGIDLKKVTLKPKGDTAMRKTIIDNFINKMVKQRSLSSRGARPSSTIFQSSVSHKLFKMNQTPSANENKGFKSKSNSNSNNCKIVLNQPHANSDLKKKINFSPSSLSLTKKRSNCNRASTLPQGNTFSFVNFILGSCFIKNQGRQLRKASESQKKNSLICNSSRNRIDLPFNKKVCSSPSPPQSKGIKMMTITKLEEEGKQQIQTISNFSKYIKKSKGNKGKNQTQMSNKEKNSMHASSISFKNSQTITKAHCTINTQKSVKVNANECKVKQ